MHDHSDWYRLFTGFWWLIFPIGWGLAALLRTVLRHNRATDALAVLKSYADQGREPPPELVAVLRQPDMPRAARGDHYARYGWIPVFLFGALACGFVVFALWPPDAGVPRVAMIFAALIMAGLCIGNLVAMQARKRRDSPP